MAIYQYKYKQLRIPGTQLNTRNNQQLQINTNESKQLQTNINKRRKLTHLVVHFSKPVTTTQYIVNY